MDFIEYAMRGGAHPDPATEAIERQVVEAAKRHLANNAQCTHKGARWTYNFIHYNLLWMTRAPALIDYLYEVRPYPQYIEVETTTYCNFQCPICEHTYWDEKPRHMTLAEFIYITDRFPDLKWIGVSGIGQSYLNPDYPRMLDHMKRRGVYIEQYDNCYYLDDERARHIVEIGLEKIFVSCDAATEATYHRMRPGSDWNRVLNNIKNLDAWKKRLHSHWPELAFHFVVCRDNAHEVVQYLELIHELGVEVAHVQFSAMLHNFHRENLFIEIPEDMVDEIQRRGRELRITVVWNADAKPCKPPMATCTAWFMPFIFVDGTVIPCCALNEQNDRSWQRATCLGNIFQEDFRRIWYGERYTRMLDGLRNGTCPDNCARCPLYTVATPSAGTPG